VNHADSIHYFTGTHYQQVNEIVLRNFLIESAVQCGVPNDIAEYQVFVEKIFKQFLINSSRHNSGVSEPDTTYINLQNGTLFFDRDGLRFEKHLPQRFIRYCLDFDYDPKATAPLWQKHLDRSLPNAAKQRYVAECLALPFYQGKIEKAPLLYGRQDTGKSTTLFVYRSLLGTENMTTESLAALTKLDYHGDYARARLDGKLVNIASDISPKINDEGMIKTIISREAVSARNPNQRGFDMHNYARLVFAMNELPPQFFIDPALTKRAAIIKFDRVVAARDKDTDFAEKIIAHELPGVLNWLIAGLKRLLKTRRLDTPPCCVAEMEQIRSDVDPLCGWLDEVGYHLGNDVSISVKSAFTAFCDYCKENGNHAPSKKKFTQRLRNLGYEIHAPNGHVGMTLFYSRTAPEYHSPESPDMENHDGGEQVRNERTHSSRSFPDESPLIPRFQPRNMGMGSEGNENSGKSLFCADRWNADTIHAEFVHETMLLEKQICIIGHLTEEEVAGSFAYEEKYGIPPLGEPRLGLPSKSNFADSFPFTPR
jgi:putative DNA primase/helicase